MGITLGGESCLEPIGVAESCRAADPPIPTDPWLGRANSFRLPLGGKPGRGWLLMRQEGLLSLGILNGTNTVTASNGPFTLEFTDDQGNTQSIAKLIVVHAEAIAPSFASDADMPYLVHVADQRHVWAMAATIDKAYNLRQTPGGSYFSGSLNSGTPWTWTQLVTDIWNTVGTSNIGSFPGLPFTPDGTPDGFRYNAMPAWDALNDVLARLACLLRMDPNGTLSIVRLGTRSPADATAKALVALSAERVWDDYENEPIYPRLPQYVMVRFRRQPRPTDGSSEWYTIKQNDSVNGDTGKLSGSVVVVEDDLPAIGSGTPSNLTALTSRATERVADWFRKAIEYNGREHYVWREIQTNAANILGPAFVEVAWEDRGAGYKTSAISMPDDPTEMLQAWRAHVEFAPYWTPPATVIVKGDVGNISPVTISAANEIDYKSTDGTAWTISNPSGSKAEALLGDADATHTGLVNKLSQVMGNGEKDFDKIGIFNKTSDRSQTNVSDTLFFGPGVSSDDGFHISSRNSSSTNPQKIVLQANSATSDTIGTVNGWTFWWWNNTVGTAVTTFGQRASPSVQGNPSIIYSPYFQFVSPAQFPAYGFDGNVIGGGFSVFGSPGVKLGVSGTDPVGNVFNGGIITTIASTVGLTGTFGG